MFIGADLSQYKKLEKARHHYLQWLKFTNGKAESFQNPGLTKCRKEIETKLKVLSLLRKDFFSRNRTQFCYQYCRNIRQKIACST